MKLERLTIESLPGIDKGYSLDGLAPGVNLVTGPNTIGKSSLIRALKYLLREHQKDDPPLSLAAEFTTGDSPNPETVRVQRTGSVSQWTRDGQATGRPALPDAEELARYCMSMEDLIAASDADQSLAGELQRALRGGFDLDEARRPIRPRHGSTEEKEVKRAGKQLREAERVAQSLGKQEDALPGLDAEIEQAREAEAQCRNIGRARELCEAVRERESLQAALDQFPEGMDKLRGEEAKELDTLQERIEKLRNEERDAVQEHGQAESELARLGIAADEQDRAEQDLSVMGRKLEEIRKLRDEIAQLQDDERKQRQNRDNAAAALGGSGTPQLNIENLAEAEGIAAPILELRKKRQELDNKIELAGTAPDEQEIKQQESAIDALREWLKNQSGALSGRPSGRILLTLLGAGLFALAGGFAIAGGFAAVLGVSVPPLSGLVLMLLSAFLFVAAWRQLRPGVNMKQAFALERYEETGVEAPRAWREEEVSKRLRELEVSRGRLIVVQNQAAGAAGYRIELEQIRDRLKQLEEQRKELAAAIGFDPLMPITALDHFLRHAQDWDRELAALAETTGKIADRQARLEQAIPALAELFTPWVDEAPIDFDSLEATAASLASRLRQARDQAEKLRGAAAGLKSIKSQLETCEQDIRDFFDRAGLASGDEQTLRERLDRLSSWQETRMKRDEYVSREAQIRKDLESAPELCELAEARDEAELDRLLETQQATARNLDSLIEQREQTRAQIRLAESGNTIAEAISTRAEARAALESKRDELLDSLATDLLLDQVESAYTADHQPEILSEAGRLFREVTAHEFSLELGTDGGFGARDLKQNAWRKLDELSTGTRMQLLLAVRTAWVGAHKSLPLFLDEALTTSDEERTTEVVRSLRSLAVAAGIQVVYFSARRNEAALWRAAVGDELCVIDLGDVRGRAPETEAAAFTLETRPALPQPAGDPEQYARELAVPPIDPQRDAGEIHLFHLLRDDLELLHRLLEDYRIHSLGQAQSMLESLGQAQSMLEHQATDEGDADAAWQPRLLERCKAARAWLVALRQGRGRRIGRNELESSGAVSHTFLDQAVALLNAKDIAGEPERLLTKLRAGVLRGYRQHKVDELESWLQETGHLDHRPQLTNADRRVQTLRQIKLSDPAQAADINRCIDHLEAGLV